MYKIELEIDESKSFDELIELSEKEEDIDIITEKNFTGDITTIEIFVATLEVLVPAIVAMIKKRKISSMKIDGEKIEVKNVSEKLIEKVLMDRINKKPESNQKEK